MILSENQKSVLLAFAEGFREGLEIGDKADQLEDIWVDKLIPELDLVVDINLWTSEDDNILRATVYPCKLVFNGTEPNLTTDCNTILVHDLFTEAM